MAAVWTLVLQCFYFMLPAYFANMAPVMVKKINMLTLPLDAGLSIRGIRLFGAHKTVRGLLFGVLFSVIVSYLQFVLFTAGYVTNVLVDYGQWLLLGLLLGFGAILGDALKSTFKRQLGIAPGKPFIPLDQLDFAIGAVLITLPITHFSFDKIILILVISVVGHVVINHLAFYSGVRKEKW